MDVTLTGLTPVHPLVRQIRSLLLGAALALGCAGAAQAGNGYFVLGYGPLAHQSAGTSTAIGMDSFAGSSNPAKLSMVGDRLDLGLLLFMPHRRIQRTGTDTPFDFSSTSENELFFLPEAGYSRRINERFVWGISTYGNGGLNTEYRDTTGIPDTNANPAKCGDQPGNFFLGCGKLGFDLAQVIVAPTLSWSFAPGHSLGAAPLLAVQRIDIYGLQAFEAFSAHPDSVSNNGYDYAFGAGLRLGWFGRITSWLDLGAAYSTAVHMQKFDEYKGLIADGGNFDIPQNFNVGLGLKPHKDWVLGFDLSRTFFGDVPGLANGVLNSFQDAESRPLGSRNGSGFNWRNLTNYKGAIAYTATPRLTLRAGYVYGRRPPADSSADSVSFNLFAPNPLRQVTAGFTWQLKDRQEIQFAYGRYLIAGRFGGDSATAEIGLGGQESIRPYVDTVMIGWTRHL